MKRLLLLCAGWPLWAASQEVRPVLSADYLALIKNDSVLRSVGQLTDTTHSMRSATIRYPGNHFNNQFKVKNIRITNSGELVLQPVQSRSILYAGSASLSMGLQVPGQQPATQHEFVQGRSNNGTLQWRGPDTGEQLSYGPSIHTLEYDGSAYDWDYNGRLIPSGSGSEGSGRKASPYNNSVLRTGAYLVNAVSLFIRYRKNGANILTTTLRAATGKEQTIIRGNNNKTENFSINTEGMLARITLTGNYSFRQERSTHNNRNGFLNRVYQNSVLSPVSFSVRQGTRLSNGQRSFSNEADNPFFLLEDNGHSFRQQQQNIHFVAERKFNMFKLRLAQSLDLRRQLSREGYQPGTAFFPAGSNLQRSTRDQNYWFNSALTWNIRFSNSYRFRAQALLNYIYTSNRSSVHYSLAHKDYRYNRRLHEPGVNFSTDYYDDDIETGMQLSAKSYLSSTGTRSAGFLPGISGYTYFRNIFHIRRFQAKVFASLSRFNSEMPLSSSYAGNALLQYSSVNAMQYLPVDEVNSFDNVLPAQHREFNTGIEFYFFKNFEFSFNYFTRRTKDDILPVPAASGGFTLLNIASCRNRGIELQLTHEPWIFKSQKFGLGNTISFTRNRIIATSVKEGYNYTPIAGFSNVHKTLVEGQPLGVITGSSWLRNNNGQLLIGTDGFPLANQHRTVIGDPNPDFILKYNQFFSYKGVLELRIDWQWNKGGDIWDGTNALLDYTGRSAVSGEQRSITGYVFNGVRADGSHNNIPVQFYNASLPVEQNRWVRYGPAGVAEAYIVPADHIRIQNISISYKPRMRKKIKELAFTLHAGNIIIWSATKGADPNQLLNDMPGTNGLHYFNLPAVRTVGFSSSIQF